MIFNFACNPLPTGNETFQTFGEKFKKTIIIVYNKKSSTVRNLINSLSKYTKHDILLVYSMKLIKINFSSICSTNSSQTFVIDTTDCDVDSTSGVKEI